ILHGAVKQGASDVHVESFKKNFTIRFRIDGMLYEVTSGDSRLASPFISRLKIMANLDIAERRLPQDGRILWECGEQEV
ncbi:ATPase, T2SS/T4P/T4SS family, partial [Klebsiella oxytoca]